LKCKYTPIAIKTLKNKAFFSNGLKLRGIPSVFYQHFLKRNAKPAPAAPSRNEKSALPQQRAFQTPKGPVSCRQPIQQTARQKGEQRTVNNDSLFTFHFSPLLSIVPSRWGNRLP